MEPWAWGGSIVGRSPVITSGSTNWTIAMVSGLPAAFLDISTKSSGSSEGAPETYQFWLFFGVSAALEELGVTRLMPRREDAVGIWDVGSCTYFSRFSFSGLTYWIPAACQVGNPHVSKGLQESWGTTSWWREEERKPCKMKCLLTVEMLAWYFFFPGGICLHPNFECFIWLNDEIEIFWTLSDKRKQIESSEHPHDVIHWIYSFHVASVGSIFIPQLFLQLLFQFPIWVIFLPFEVTGKFSVTVYLAVCMCVKKV